MHDDPLSSQPAKRQTWFRLWLTGLNSLGLDRTHTVSKTFVIPMLALSVPGGLMIDGLVHHTGAHAAPVHPASLAASFVRGLSALTEEPLGPGLQDCFWSGMAVLLPAGLILGGLAQLAVLVSRSFRF